MNRGELEKYLNSLNEGAIDEEKMLKEYTPSILEINGELVYLFNKGFDITNFPIDENISISQQPYDSAIPLHMHDYIELMYVYRGSCTVTINGQIVHLHKGEFIFINKETPHKVNATDRQDIVINIILKQDYLSPGFLGRLSQRSIISQFMIESLLSYRKQNHFLIFRPEEHANSTEIMENIMCEFFDRDFCSAEIIDSYLIVLFSTLIRHNHNQKRQTAIINDKTGSLLEFLAYIELHYRDCDLVTMGKAFGFHPSYLSTLLKKGTGKSFKELLQLQRLNQAALFLVNSELPISEIAEEVGYSSVTFFYKKFKEIFGLSPSAYRHTQLPS